MAGIICGAYSSVCISGPIWYYLRMAQEKKKAAGRKGGSGKKDAAPLSKNELAMMKAQSDEPDLSEEGKDSDDNKNQNKNQNKNKNKGKKKKSGKKKSRR